MIENEAKYLLDEKQYTEICNSYIWESEYTQTNFYYDTPNYFFAMNGYTIRIRSKSNKYYLQIKYPDTSTTKYFRSRIEKSREIPSLLEELPCRLVDELDIILPEEPLTCVGSLFTHRRTLQLSNNEKLFLDLNYYGYIDFEIEIEILEVSKDSKRQLEKLTKKHDLNSPSHKGKYHRMIDYINSIKLL